jgi:hypothetical protein
MRPLVDDAAQGAQVSRRRAREGRPAARECGWLPRSLAPGPSQAPSRDPKSGPTMRRHHGPRRTGDQSHIHTGTAHTLSRKTPNRSRLAGARRHIPPPPLLPFRRLVRPQLADVASTVHPPGSTARPRPSSTRLGWPSQICAGGSRKGRPRRKQRTLFPESPGAWRRRSRRGCPPGGTHRPRRRGRGGSRAKRLRSPSLCTRWVTRP